MKKVCTLIFRSIRSCAPILFIFVFLIFFAGLAKTFGQTTSGKPLLFVENLDRFPSNDDFTASRVQNPWSRDKIVYNTNHDTIRIRLHNKGMTPLVISSFVLSNSGSWRIVTLKGTAYNQARDLPLNIASGSFADLQVRFIAANQAIRVLVLSDELTIVSNDVEAPKKVLYLHGLYQRNGEGSKEPTAQEMINAFGFKTKTGFASTDPDRGANNKPKGDEVPTAYFVRVDASRPVTVRQMGAYHGCCNQSESLRWYPKGKTESLTTVVYHVPEDAQRLLPRRNRNSNYTPSEGSFNPTGAFGFKVGGKDWSDTDLTPSKKIGIRVWKAIDSKGRPIQNSYIIANDYLGTDVTNYDYNDNMYFVTNVRPDLGPAAASMLASTPSAVDFEETLLQSNTSFTLNLKSLGQNYASGAKDPVLPISSVEITGVNRTEFSAAMPAKKELNPQETTTLTVSFKPVSEGLKIADLLIHYNNGASPLRIPLHGIAKAVGTTVTVPYRINSGSASNVTLNGKTWLSDRPYAFDNLEPYTNTQVTQISATDEDRIYLTGQSSNGDKKPFRYEFPLENGNYWVRLHFAEIYWGNPGSGLNGGAGSRVMSIRLEDELKVINLDVTRVVGTASALVRNIPVTVSDGKLNINFSATANRPMVCAVEVYHFKTAPGSPPPITTPAITHSITVYPNPLRNQFTIRFPADYSREVTLQVTDALGRVYELGKKQLATGTHLVEADISHLGLSAGVYFLRIHSVNNSKAIFYKLVIQ